MDKSKSSSDHSLNKNEESIDLTASGSSSIEKSSESSKSNEDSSDQCTASGVKEESSARKSFIRTKISEYLSRPDRTFGYGLRFLDKGKDNQSVPSLGKGEISSDNEAKLASELASEEKASSEQCSAGGSEASASPGMKTKIVEYFSRYDIKKFGYGLRLQEEERLERERLEKERKEKEKQEKEQESK